jgi:hypothetical protein
MYSIQIQKHCKWFQIACVAESTKKREQNVLFADDRQRAGVITDNITNSIFIRLMATTRTKISTISSQYVEAVMNLFIERDELPYRFYHRQLLPHNRPKISQHPADVYEGPKLSEDEVMERHGDERATPKSITYEESEEWVFEPLSSSGSLRSEQVVVSSVHETRRPAQRDLRRGL